MMDNTVKGVEIDPVREKLIELITDRENDLIRKIVWFTDTYRIKEVADHLIANGVTIATDNNVGDKSSPTGCEYCQEDAEGYRRMIGAFSITNPFHGRTWQIETAHCKPREIFFCPMCGRKFPKKG